MKLFYLCLGLFCTTTLFSQEQISGPVIKDFGKTYPVLQPEFKTDISATHNVVFDVGRSFDNPKKINPLLETAARYINMHVNAGVPKENINVALVVHGSAANDLLTNTEYLKRVKGAETKNPNTGLLSALSKNNVKIILCGQTAASRNMTKADTHNTVKLALSAMTALVQLQANGYQLINF